MVPDLFHSLQIALADTYQLERELGRGGMAMVYLARELKHPRHVAIKVLRPELAGVMTRGRFLREIRISSELAHPHILPLLDSGVIPPTDRTPELPYYTMPYVEGESLRDRLNRDHQLPLEEALQIARDIGAALGYAHAHGVIHRDIKPANILLMEGHAVVADFGIARAIKEAVDPDAVTSAGIVIGTPSYMSPEQAGGMPDLDGRSDLYSLGCVLYEMLGGEPPFTGASAQAVLARHRMDRAPSLRTIRSSVPVPVEQAVMRALEKTPADRFAGATAFVDALQPGSSGEWEPTPQTRPTLRRRGVWITLVLAITVGTTWYMTAGGAAERRAVAAAAALDTTRYAIVSFTQDSGVPDLLQPTLLLEDALREWEGVNVVDQFQVREAIARHDTSGYVRQDWDRLATGLGAARYIRADATRMGDSIRVHAVLYRVAPGSGDPVVREHTIRLPMELRDRDRAFAELSEGLLLRSGGLDASQSAGQTSSLPARQAFDLGFLSINEWNLAAADSHFSAALHFDPSYAQAHLWLALVRLWTNPDESATWRSPAERAVAGRGDLSSRDRQVADAMLSQAQGDLLAACQRWDQLTREHPYDFVVWYGLAICLGSDRIVLPDPRSPTRWRFRSSYYAALNAYEQAYRLFPPIFRELRADSYSQMVHLLLASGTDFRIGRGVPPDPPIFYAFPAWIGDTLVLYPVVWGEDGITSDRGTATALDAIRHQRQRLLNIASSWVAEYPANADAMQALAVSLQLLGDRTALDTVLKARRLAQGADEIIRVAASEIWMRVLFSTPSNLGELRAARRLADSLLTNAPPDGALEPKLLASLAALTGRAHLAASLGRKISTRDRNDTPPALVGIGITFLTYASMGGPVDSLRALAPRVLEALQRDVDAERRARAEEMWLRLPVLVGFPTVQLPIVSQLSGPSGGLMNADDAYLRRDTVMALRAMEQYRSAGQVEPPGVRTVDLGLGTAWLLSKLGDTDAAIAWLDPILNALPRTPPQLFLEVYQAGPLVRAMVLRANLAEAQGDRATAMAWATGRRHPLVRCRRFPATAGDTDGGARTVNSSKFNGACRSQGGRMTSSPVPGQQKKVWVLALALLVGPVAPLEMLFTTDATATCGAERLPAGSPHDPSAGARQRHWRRHRPDLIGLSPTCRSFTTVSDSWSTRDSPTAVSDPSADRLAFGPLVAIWAANELESTFVDVEPGDGRATAVPRRYLRLRSGRRVSPPSDLSPGFNCLYPLERQPIWHAAIRALASPSPHPRQLRRAARDAMSKLRRGVGRTRGQASNAR